jgi:hypothetical protein
MRACGNEYENELETERGMGIVFGGWSRLCRLRTVRCWLVKEFLIVLAMYPCWVSLTSVIPSQERLTSYWEWRDGESSMYPRD